ncbi:hypothetical protein FE257_010479 [Aspergillus nanangensis]|uniref:Azaphilone pigments biosynthesis cluster protein L N-terminal domain-containing protein n=1 Tax=Aspergillus nanangensis TaxID=2582783 RepID=A0AAD4CIP5_ASPNN|nr:hypothetical protein FE257_010479 [Aspergillus nanangensis]
MAEPLSVASSLVTLAGVAFQASKSLYQSIQSFKSVKRTIRELCYDLESLTQVLEALQQIAAQNEAQFAALRLPLLRCGKICREFEETVNNCVTHSVRERRSFRDWAKLQYRGGDIADLRTTLAGYKATISIALGGATFRQVAVTRDVLDEYKQMIGEATSDLREHLENIDERFQSLLQRESVHGREGIDLRDMTEDKESTEQCLRICAQVSEFIEDSHSHLSRDDYSGEDLPSNQEEDLTRSHGAKMATKAMLIDFRTRLSENSATLNARLTELNTKLQAFAREGTEYMGRDTASLDLMREERDSIVKCLDICTDASAVAENARTNTFEDVASADYSHQLVVSTIGDLISAKHIVTGARSVQWLGQMSDDTLQKLSRDQRDRIEEVGESQTQTERDTFRERYGSGFNLQVEGLPERRRTPSGGNC